MRQHNNLTIDTSIRVICQEKTDGAIILIIPPLSHPQNIIRANLLIMIILIIYGILELHHIL
jgi:hypothetical protein